MVELHSFLHYLTALALTIVPALCAAYSQGKAAEASFKARRIQPAIEDDLTKLLLVGNAITETSALLGLILGIMLLTVTPTNCYSAYATLGIFFAFGVTGSFVAYACSHPLSASLYALSRQPFFSSKIRLFSVIMQSIMQTPVILAFLIAFFIKNQIIHVTSLSDSIRLISAGLALGLGSIGPILGLKKLLTQSCSGLGINRNSYQKLLSFSFINEAMIGASIIFSLLIALAILGNTSADTALSGIHFFSAALCIGLGTLGVGIGLGKIAQRGALAIGLNPLIHSTLTKTTLIAQALIEAQTIYAFIIALRILKVA